MTEVNIALEMGTKASSTGGIGGTAPPCKKSAMDYLCAEANVQDCLASSNWMSLKVITHLLTGAQSN